MSEESKDFEKKNEKTELSDDFRTTLLRITFQEEVQPIGLFPQERTAIVPQFNAELLQKVVAFLPITM